MNLSRSWQFLGARVAALCLANVGLLAPLQAATDGLSGTVWQLVQFQGGTGQILRPDDGSNYTVEFKADSTVVVRLDCHRGRATWVSRSTAQLELGPLAMTRATCPQTSLHDQITKQWTFIRSYALRDKHLFLSLMADGGTYEFEPVNSEATRSTPESWLDESKPASWNMPGAAIPHAPKMEEPVDSRCRTHARVPESEADKRLADLGWDLIGGYQGGWGIFVIQGAAGYDGMCRPRAYQDFVFLRGVFAGTLSPRTMDARADGALNRVTLEDSRRLVVEYARYTAADPLCCPSKSTTVEFEIGSDQAVVRPVSLSTSFHR
jgi:LppP/LprE lipoprotein/META domain